MEIAVWEKTYTYIPFTDFYQYSLLDGNIGKGQYIL